MFYGAEAKRLEYESHLKVAAFLALVQDAFRIEPSRHLMSLYTNSGVELPTRYSLEEAGVEPGGGLILRRRTAKDLSRKKRAGICPLQQRDG